MPFDTFLDDDWQPLTFALNNTDGATTEYTYDAISNTIFGKITTKTQHNLLNTGTDTYTLAHTEYNLIATQAPYFNADGCDLLILYEIEKP